jgi:hypothetical protein
MFVSLDVQHHAETSDMKNMNYTFKNGTKLSLYIVDNKYYPDINLINHILLFMDKIAHEYFNTEVKTKPNITIFLGLQKKLLPIVQDKLLAPDNINSGSTIFGDSITIWRYEEVYKVLIHELVHFYGIDFYIDDNNYDKLQNYVKNNYCIHGFDMPNESFTETLAVLIHTMFISEYMNEKFENLLWKEFIHNFIQINKILNFYNISSFDEINNKNNCKNNINQRTSVFSYYIVKTSLLNNINNYLTFLSNLPSKNNIHKFIDLVDESLNDENFVDYISNINKVVNGDDNNKNNYLKTNMRMTCLQIE